MESKDEVRDPISHVRYAFATTREGLVVDCWLEPGGALPPHFHPQQAETWSVIDGRAKLRIGDSARVVGPDDGPKVVAPGVVHAVTSVLDRDAHLRCLASPPLRLRAFLEESAAAAPARPDCGACS